MKFLDLLRNSGKSPYDMQMMAQRRFPHLAAARRLRLWRKNDVFSHTGWRILIGVAMYSEPDLRMLDRLADDCISCRAHVDVFDVSEVTTMEDLECYVPGIGLVCQTPLVGIWHDGKLIERMQGLFAWRRLRELVEMG